MLVENGLKLRFVSLYGKLAAACTGPTDHHYHHHYREELNIKLTKLRENQLINLYDNSWGV